MLDLTAFYRIEHVPNYHRKSRFCVCLSKKGYTASDALKNHAEHPKEIIDSTASEQPSNLDSNLIIDLEHCTPPPTPAITPDETEINHLASNQDAETGLHFKSTGAFFMSASSMEEMVSWMDAISLHLPAKNHIPSIEVPLNAKNTAQRQLFPSTLSRGIFGNKTSTEKVSKNPQPLQSMKINRKEQKALDAAVDMCPIEDFPNPIANDDPPNLLVVSTHLPPSPPPLEPFIDNSMDLPPAPFGHPTITSRATIEESGDVEKMPASAALDVDQILARVRMKLMNLSGTPADELQDLTDSFDEFVTAFKELR